MRFVVTGTGRSGTRWASQVLGVGHQQMFTGEGFVDTGEKGDASFWAASEDLEGWRVLLLVRDPRYVVASWLNTGEFEHMLDGYWRLWQHCNRIDWSIVHDGMPRDIQARIERYWWGVNHSLAERADVVMKVEDATPEALADACGEVPYSDVPAPVSETEPATLSAPLKAFAKEFGYDC